MNPLPSNFITKTGVFPPDLKKTHSGYFGEVACSLYRKEYWELESREVVDPKKVEEKLKKEFEKANPQEMVYTDEDFTSEAFCDLESALASFEISPSDKVLLATRTIEDKTHIFRTTTISTIGGREKMEDAFSVFDHKQNFATFGIFDGHGGDTIAKRAAEELPKLFQDHLFSLKEPSPVHLWNCLKGTFVDFQKKMFVENSHKKDSSLNKVGSTGLFVVCKEKEIWAANTGDGAGIFYDRKKRKAVVIARDQKTLDADMKKGIEKRNGIVNAKGYVNGYVNVPRAFGDFFLFQAQHSKELGISPLTSRPKITQISKEEGALLLGCDGFWKHYLKDDAGAIFDLMYRKQIPMEKIAYYFVNEAIKNGSTDNITLTIVQIEEKNGGKSE